jgi:hypothetical protein
VTVVQEVTRSNALSSNSTSCNPNNPGEQAPLLLLSLATTQEEPGCDDRSVISLPYKHVAREDEFNCDSPTDQKYRTSSYASEEDADNSGSEQIGGSQNSADVESRPPADHCDDVHDQDPCSNNTRVPGTTPYPPKTPNQKISILSKYLQLHQNKSYYRVFVIK